MLAGIAGIHSELAELVPRKEDVRLRQQESSSDKVLGRGDERLAIPRRADVLGHAHETQRFGARVVGLRQVQIHLVAVEVGRGGAVALPLRHRRATSPGTMEVGGLFSDFEANS